MIINQLPQIVSAQATAISKIKFDKVVVYDGGNGQGNGNATSNWLNNLTKTLPQLHELAAAAGIQLPSILGNLLPENEKTIPTPSQEVLEPSSANAEEQGVHIEESETPPCTPQEREDDQQ